MSAPHTGTNTLGTDSNFQLLSDQEPQSPQDVALTRPLPPSPRPNSPQSPTATDFSPVPQAFQSLLQQILLLVPQSQPIGSLHTQPQPTRRNRKAMTEVKPFHGEDSTMENPQDFIKAFNRAMRECTTISTEYEKIEALADYMVGGSAVEEWYNALPTDCQLSWDKLRYAFDQRWPPIQRAAKTTKDYEKELLDLTLAEEDIGTIKTKSGVQAWTHVIWAEGALALEKLAKVEKSAVLIWQVREKLPEMVRDLLDEEYVNWEMFTGAVKGLSTGKLKEGKAKLEKRRKDEEAMEWRVWASVSDITSRLQRISITPTIRNPTNMVHTTSPTTTRFAVQQRPRQQVYNTAEPVTEAQREALRLIIKTYEQHPPTTAGRQAHQAQVTQWTAKHGENT